MFLLILICKQLYFRLFCSLFCGHEFFPGNLKVIFLNTYSNNKVDTIKNVQTYHIIIVPIV